MRAATTTFLTLTSLFVACSLANQAEEPIAAAGGGPSSSGTTVGGTGGAGGTGVGGTGVGGTGAGDTGAGGSAACSSPDDCPAGGNACVLAICDAGACDFTNAPSGTDCPGGACDGAGICTVGTGTPCDDAAECASGFCVDGVCCAGPCDGSCVGCSSGSCAPHPIDSDPDDDCPGSSVCDGAGSCGLGLGEPCGANADCISNQCVDGLCCESACNDPCGRCNAPNEPGFCTPLADGAPSEGANCDPYYCDGANLVCPTQCAATEDCMQGTFCGPNSTCGPGYPNGLGGFYSGAGATEQENALLACESYWGAGQCCNDGCGSCNAKGYHMCGTPNCNGSVYWNYANDLQDMGCNWVDPNEILISLDGQTWTQ